jgi:hypothetical protein
MSIPLRECDLDQSLGFGFAAEHCRTGESMLPYDELVKLARFCANQARTTTEKEVASRAWRLAVQYQEDAAKLGERPEIGEKPLHVAET